jgi:hypothetical protein
MQLPASCHGTPRSWAPGDELNPVPGQDRTAYPTQEGRRRSQLHGAGSRGRYPNTRGFVVDAMLALVYPARSRWNQRRLTTTGVARSGGLSEAAGLLTLKVLRLDHDSDLRTGFREGHRP